MNDIQLYELRQGYVPRSLTLFVAESLTKSVTCLRLRRACRRRLFESCRHRKKKGEVFSTSPIRNTRSIYRGELVGSGWLFKP
jgi:hypothetical protein